MRFFFNHFQSDDRRCGIINGSIMKNGRRTLMRIDNVRLGNVIRSAANRAANRAPTAKLILKGSPT